MKKPDGGSAFPFHHVYANGDAREDDGMSLRDYFAGQAMVSLIAARLKRHGDDQDVPGYGSWVDFCGWGATIHGSMINDQLATPARDVACDAYFIADTMLKARKIAE